MPRTVKKLTGELISWPECGGFQYDRLIELLVELEARVEALERTSGVLYVTCDCCGWTGPRAALNGESCPSCGAHWIGATP